MKIAEKIEKKINKILTGQTFTYNDLAIKKEEYPATAKALERLIKKGVIKRVSTGVYYKPKQSVFGELKPNDVEIIQPYLFKNGKRIAYITGTLLFNQMGLTTQIPKEVKIASREKRIYISKYNVKATAVKSYVEVTDQNYYLLEFLDVLKDLKKIPDLDIKLVITILSNRIKELKPKDIKQLIKISLSYPPRVRALLGAILENINQDNEIKKLADSLNPLTKYEIGINKTILPSIENWNIK